MRRDECVVDGDDGKRTGKPASIDRRLHGRADFPIEKHGGQDQTLKEIGSLREIKILTIRGSQAREFPGSKGPGSLLRGQDQGPGPQQNQRLGDRRLVLRGNRCLARKGDHHLSDHGGVPGPNGAEHQSQRAEATERHRGLTITGSEMQREA